MKLVLESLELKDFKGVKEAKYDFGKVTRICGENGSGKSTIADAWYWLWVNRDSRIVKDNPDIRPVGQKESLPTVTANILVDGKPCTITKRQHALPSTGDGKPPVSNKYELNGVERSESYLWGKLNEMGIEKDTFLALSHPASFTSAKTAKMREILFGMATSHTDIEIAGLDEETKILVPLLEQYSAEEIEGMNKATLKAAKERVASIPDIIIGMERSKVPGTVEELEAKKAAVIAEMNALNIPNTAKLSEEIGDINNAIRAMEQDAAQRRWEIKKAAKKKYEDAADDYDRQKYSIDSQEREITTKGYKLNDIKREIDRCRDEYTALKDEFDAEKKAKFEDEYVAPKPLTESDLVCPTCGQKLTMKMRDERIKAYKAEVEESKRIFDERVEAWQKDHDGKMKKCQSNAKVVAEDHKKLVKEYNALAAEIKTLNEEVESKRKAVSEYERKVKAAEDHLKETDECYDLLDPRIEQLKEEVAKKNKEMTAAQESKKQRYEYEDRIKEIDREIVIVRHNDEIDAKIDDLNDELLRNEQSKANAERIIDALGTLRQKKNEMLTEEINRHFKIVNFKLFDYLKNGKVEATCIPMIDGKAFNESLNTGKEIAGKLDICEGLQNFYDKHYPIFLDNAESINSWNVPEVDTQLVLLTVTEDKTLVVQ